MKAVSRPGQPSQPATAATCAGNHPPGNDELHPRIYRYRLDAHRLLAFERNINYQMSEDLKQAGGNESLEKSVEIEAKLVAPAHVYDLRTQKYYGKVSAFRFSLDPWRPSLFAVADEPIQGDLVSELGRNQGGSQ